MSWTTFNKTSPNEGKLVELQAECAQLESRYNLVTNNIAAAVIIRDREGRTTFCSPYTEVLTGYSPEEVLSREDLLESISCDTDRSRYLRARQIGELGEDSLVRYQIRHKKGLLLWLETRFVPVCDEQGEVDTVMSVTTDVTASVNYQRQIEEQNRDLNDFAYMVSHDLKAPIFTIKGMASALQEDHGNELTDDAKGLLKFITDGSERLERLVASILEYSRIQLKQGESSEVDLNTVIQSVLRDQTQHIEEAGARISVEADLPNVKGEPIRLYQVFSNLIGNALKYRSSERPLRIHISKLPIETNNSGRVSLLITDNGIGIPKDKLESIFRPYQRAHGNDIEGSGIGLACVKKIMDRIGGSVTVESTEGTGSTFRLSFHTLAAQPQSVPADLERVFGE